jgi:hypothetical protein
MKLRHFGSMVAALALFVACGNGAKEAHSEAEPGLGVTTVAGGETSELSGGNIAYCPEAGASFTPLALESAEIARHVSLAEGHHEASLLWQSAFVTDVVGGYAEHTRVSLDVTVLSARDVLFGEANLGYEGSGCRGTRQRQIELAINLSTKDGALGGSFRHWVTPANALDLPGSPLLASTSKADNFGYPLRDFESTLELDAQSVVELGRELRVQLGFDAEAVRGSLQLSITTREPASESGRGLFVPLAAVFPDDGCAPALPVSLDAAVAELGATPRDAYQRLRAGMESGPIRAGWWDESDPSQFDVEWTEVTLRGGEPTYACLSAQGVLVYAPLSIESADGRVSHTRTIASTLRADGAESGGSLPLMRGQDFERATGVHGFDFAGIEYASVYVSLLANRAGSELQGWLMATQWEATEEHALGRALEWCSGLGCDAFWCQRGIALPELACPRGDGKAPGWRGSAIERVSRHWASPALR